MFCLYQLLQILVCTADDSYIFDLDRIDTAEFVFKFLFLKGRCSNLLWSVCGISPISSNRIVPWLANSNLPGFPFLDAPEKAPGSYPNNSDSSSSVGIAAQLILYKDGICADSFHGLLLQIIPCRHRSLL